MTLDEMIAFVSDQAAADIRGWNSVELDIQSLESEFTEYRQNIKPSMDAQLERAAALINVENALRRMKAMADEASGELA